MTALHGPFGALLRSALREQRGALAGAAFALLGVVLLELATPWPLKLLFDHLLLAKPLPAGLAWLQPLLGLGAWPALGLLAGAMAVLALATGALSYLQILHTAQVGHHLTWRLRAALFAHLQRLPLAYHRASRSGELMAKLAQDTHLLRDLYGEWALNLVRQGLTVLAMMGVMAWLNPRLALAVAVTLPPLLWVIYRLNRRVKKAVREQRRHDGRMAARLNEVLGGITLVQAFARQQHEEGRFRETIHAGLHSGLRSTRAAGATARAVTVLSALGSAAVLLLGAAEVLAARLTPGELLIFMAYVGSLYKPVRDLARLSNKLARAGVSQQRVAELLAAAPDAPDAPDAQVLRQPRGEVAFAQVHFAYAGGAPVLRGLNLHVAAGEHVAIVGASGAGKSTLLNLLLRLDEPTQGEVRLDDQPLRHWTRDSLRQAIGLVPQEPLLFAVSVRENLRYGAPEASAEAVREAAVRAQAHEFISALPQGYDTELSERGGNLSGGQRQRLCLARALLKRPAVLVLDEPTSAIDAASSRLIHATLATTFRTHTVITITHAEADLHHYDRVLELRDGVLRPWVRALPPPTLALVPERRHA